MRKIMSDYSQGILVGVAAASMLLVFSANFTISHFKFSREDAQVREQLIELREMTGLKMQAKVTAYCPCSKCCGSSADGITSTGRNALTTRGVAVDPKRIKYGSKITIPGAGTFLADDTGGDMRNSDVIHIDLRFATHQEALNWGVQQLVIIVE